MKAAADGDSAAPAKKRPKVTFKSREFVDTEDEDVEVAPSERRGSDGRGEKAKADTPSDQEDWEESEESEESEDLEELIKAKKVSELGSASGKFFFFSDSDILYSHAMAARLVKRAVCTAKRHNPRSGLVCRASRRRHDARWKASIPKSCIY